MNMMKNKNFKKSLLLFGTMSGLSIILCQIVGSSLVGNGAYPTLFIQFIVSILLLCLPIFYVWGVVYLIKLMSKKNLYFCIHNIMCFNNNYHLVVLWFYAYCNTSI